MPVGTDARIEWLKRFGRTIDGVQIIILVSMGYYFFKGGSQQLSGKQWIGLRDFFGGYENVGLIISLIGLVGFLGVLSQLIGDGEGRRAYYAIMWVFTTLAVAWCFTVAGFQTYALFNVDGAGNAGLWTWGMNGLFFLFTRVVIIVIDTLDTRGNEHD